MPFRNKNIRRRAWEAMRGNWGKVLGFSILAQLPGMVIGFCVGLLLPFPTGLVTVLGMFISAALSFLILGMLRGLIGMLRGETLTFETIFSLRAFWLKAAGLTLMLGIPTLLPALLPPFLGLLAMIAGLFLITLPFAMSTYVFAENPERGIGQVLEESKRLMRDSWGRYVAFMLRLVVWFVLAMFIITTVAMMTTVDLAGMESFDPYAVAVVPTWLMSLLFLLPIGYWNTCTSAFYLDLKEAAKPEEPKETEEDEEPKE